MIQTMNPYVSDVTWTILAKRFGRDNADKIIDLTVQEIKEIGLDAVKDNLSAELLIIQDYEDLISEEEVS